MGDDITIGVTEIVNNIEVTAQPNDQIVDISVIDNTDEVTLNITPTVIEINVNQGSSYAKWGTILGTLSDQEDLQEALELKADLVDGLVPAYQLPSYIDDVIEVPFYAALPVTGEAGKIYVTVDNNKIYRWTGSVYVEITDNTAVWGAITGTLSNQTDLQSALNAKQNNLVSGTNIKTIEGQSLVGSGNINLIKSDVGLSNVDDTSDLNKPVSIATQNALNFKANDSAVVHLTGNETISGIKNFSSATQNNLFFLNESSGFGGFAGYSQLAVTADYFQIINGTNSKSTKLIHNGSRDLTMPASDGTLALISQIPTVTGTTNFLPKFTGSSSLGNSLLFDNGTNVGIGTSSPGGIGTTLNLYGGLGNSNLVLEGNNGNSFLSLLSSATNGVPPSFISKDGFRFAYASDKSGTGYVDHMRITSSGNVGIGTSSPSEKLDVSGNIKIGAGNRLMFSSTAYMTPENNVSGAEIATGGILTIKTGGATERLRVDASGNVLVNTTSLISNDTKMEIKGDSSNYCLYLNAPVIYAGIYRFQRFYANGNAVGDINSNGTTTSYNITSDYRLKQDFKSFSGLDLVSKIKVYDYEWKYDNSRMNGVIAHELQEVVPYAVTGEKDGENMQGVDYSKLVPILVQAIQELKAEIEILKNK